MVRAMAETETTTAAIMIPVLKVVDSARRCNIGAMTVSVFFVNSTMVASGMIHETQ